jgi:flagellar motor component MotA
LAILTIKSIFEDDNSKIVSKQGKKFLSDDKKMQDINEKIQLSESNNQHQDIFV